MSFQPDPFANNSPDPFAPTPTDGFEGSYTLATASDNRQYKPTVTGLGMFSAPWPLLLAALCYIGIAGVFIYRMGAHDDRFNAIVNSANLNAGVDSTFVDEKLRDKVDIDLISDAEPTAEQKDEAAHQFALFSLKEWQEAMYTRIVNKVGNRTYWEDWADDVADITQTQITRIKASLEVASPELKREFDIFVG